MKLQKKVKAVLDNWKFDFKLQMYKDFYVCQECRRLFQREGSFYLHNDLRHNNKALNIGKDKTHKTADNDTIYTISDNESETSEASTSSRKSRLTVENVEIHTKKTSSGVPLELVREFILMKSYGMFE
jgi:hypothetical protein